jgi:Fe-S cluster assembly scaffold protein SufB
VELPLIFIEYIRNNKLESYNDKKVEKEISEYLDEILEEVAVPRLIEVLEGEDNEEIIDALKRIEKIANENLDMTRPIKPYLEDLMNKKNNEIKNLADNILGLFRKEERRKELNKKRKVMKEKEDLFLEGKISAEEYAEARKEYLTFRDNR